MKIYLRQFILTFLIYSSTIFSIFALQDECKNFEKDLKTKDMTFQQVSGTFTIQTMHTKWNVTNYKKIRFDSISGSEKLNDMEVEVEEIESNPLKCLIIFDKKDQQGMATGFYTITKETLLSQNSKPKDLYFKFK